MSDLVREAFEAHYFSCHGGGNMTFDHANSYYLDSEVNDYWLAFQAGEQAALSANGGEVVGWLVSRKGDGTFPRFYFDKGLAEDMVKEVELPPSATMSPVYTHPTPPSVAVPEGWSVRQVEDQGNAGFIVGSPRVNGVRTNTSLWLDDEDPAHQLLAHMLAAAPSPDHSGDANKVVDDLPGMWDQSDLSGGETDADHIADAGKVSFVDGLGAQRMTAEECKEGIEYIIHGDNIYWPLSDDDELRLIQAACGNGEFTYPQATPSVPENDNGVSSAYDSGYLDAMLYARVCCDRLDNPENTKDYRDCARFLDLIFKSEIDEAARLRTTDDKAEGV